MSKRVVIGTLAVITTIVLLGAATRVPQARAKPSRFIYVWAGTGMMDPFRNIRKPGEDMIAVVDADASSPKYGTVIDVLPVDSGWMPHHVELELPKKGPLFANDFGADKSYLIDFTNPAHPKLAGRMDAVPGAHSAHSFARLTNGHVLATVQFGDGTVAGNPGSLAEFDANGKLLRQSSSADPAFPGAKIRTYALTVLPAIDRVVTTSNPMDTERTAHVVQVWRKSDLKLLKTLALPEVATDSAYMFPFELKTMADGRSVLMYTYYCGFYRITGLESDPRIERVMAMSHPKNIGCGVPIVSGKYMVVPVAYAHRYATLDISNPAHPVEVSSLDTDSTYYPHWLARDPHSDRVVMTDQGDGPPNLRIAHFNIVTGKLTWDEKFRDPGAKTFGLNFMNVSWPGGIKGMVMPHGALFVP